MHKGTSIQNKTKNSFHSSGSLASQSETNVVTDECSNDDQSQWNTHGIGEKMMLGVKVSLLVPAVPERHVRAAIGASVV